MLHPYIQNVTDGSTKQSPQKTLKRLCIADFKLKFCFFDEKGAHGSF